MELSKYIAYALPEGMHELYAQAPQPEAQSVPVADAEIRELIVRLSHISKVSNFEGDRRTTADAARMLATLGDALAVLVARPEAQSVRDEVIEECARASDTTKLNCGCAAKVRALKSAPPQKPVSDEVKP